jgi:aerotaxis receptor
MLMTANRMAAGDLTQVMDEAAHDLKGRLSRALNQLNVNLARWCATRAPRSSPDAPQHERDRFAGNHDLSARTESQAANLQQTAARWSRSPAPCATAPKRRPQAARLARTGLRA